MWVRVCGVWVHVCVRGGVRLRSVCVCLGVCLYEFVCVCKECVCVCVCVCMCVCACVCVEWWIACVNVSRCVWDMDVCVCVCLIIVWMHGACIHVLGPITLV